MPRKSDQQKTRALALYTIFKDKQLFNTAKQTVV